MKKKNLLIAISCLLLVGCSFNKENKSDASNIKIKYVGSGVNLDFGTPDWCTGNHFYFEFEIANNSSDSIIVNSSSYNNFCLRNKNAPKMELFLSSDRMKHYCQFSDCIDGAIPLEIMNLFEDSVVQSGESILLKVSHDEWHGVSDSILVSRKEFIENSTPKFSFENLLSVQQKKIILEEGNSFSVSN